MVIVLLVITLVSAASLGVVYSVTKGPIEAAKAAKTTSALAQVIPAFDNDPTVDTVTYFIDGMPIKVSKGKSGSEVSGYAVETMTRSGFSGEVRLMVGFKPDGEIMNIEVLQQNETPGLGSKMADPGNVLLVSFQGRNPKDLKMSVKKDGGDIDVITASTISSRAYVDAVDRAYKAFQMAIAGVDGTVADPAPTHDFAALFGEYDNNPAAEKAEVTVDGAVVTVYPVRSAGMLKGYTTESAAKGLKGMINLLVGFTADDILSDIVVLQQNETPGWGAAITEPDNVMLASLKGRKAGDIAWSLKANGGSVDAISGSTVTTNAYLLAVKNAYIAYKSYVNQKTSNE